MSYSYKLRGPTNFFLTLLGIRMNLKMKNLKIVRYNKNNEINRNRMLSKKWC